MGKKIVLLGPPLSGKGTQGQLLAEKLGFPRLSVGALIRKLFKEKKRLGIEGAKYMVKGEAIPGNILMAILDPWFKNHEQNFIIDNLIRTEDQLVAFDQYCRKNNLKIDRAIYLTIPEREIFKRFQTRIFEHSKDNRVREDEKPEVLKARIKVYQSSVRKILTYFRQQHILSRVSANHSVSKVHEDLLRILKITLNGDN